MQAPAFKRPRLTTISDANGDDLPDAPEQQQQQQRDHHHAQHRWQEQPQNTPPSTAAVQPLQRRTRVRTQPLQVQQPAFDSQQQAVDQQQHATDQQHQAAHLQDHENHLQQQLQQQAPQQQQQQKQPWQDLPACNPLFKSGANVGGLPPLDLPSPTTGGNWRRSSVMSTATVAPAWLAPISPLNLGGCLDQDQQQQDLGGAQAEGQQQPASTTRSPKGIRGLGNLAVDVNFSYNASSAIISGAGDVTLTPGPGEALTPGRLLMGSPVDLGDGMERSVNVAAELGLTGSQADLFGGLLASPERLLASPRGLVLASLRDVVLASPGGCGRTGGAAGKPPRRLAGELSPLATTPHTTALQRHMRSRNGGGGGGVRRSVSFSAGAGQRAQETAAAAAWVPCSFLFAGSGGGGVSSGDGDCADVLPWMAGRVGLEEPQLGAPRAQDVQEVQPDGGAMMEGWDLGDMQQDEQQQQQQQQQHGYWGQQQQQVVVDVTAASGEQCQGKGRLHGVPLSIIREVKQQQRQRRAAAASVMLGSVQQVWQSAGR